MAEDKFLGSIDIWIQDEASESEIRDKITSLLVDCDEVYDFEWRT